MGIKAKITYMEFFWRRIRRSTRSNSHFFFNPLVGVKLTPNEKAHLFLYNISYLTHFESNYPKIFEFKTGIELVRSEITK